MSCGVRARSAERGVGAFACRAGIIAALSFALALTGCTAQSDPGAASASPSAAATSPVATPTASSTPTASAAPSARPTTFDPKGTVEENLAVFTRVVEKVWAGKRRQEGRAYIDALVAAGFDKSAMELTSDTTTVGNAAESIQFSVRWRKQCLLGQVGPATGDPVTIVAPVLDEARCLVGDTRPIDW